MIRVLLEIMPFGAIIKSNKRGKHNPFLIVMISEIVSRAVEQYKRNIEKRDLPDDVPRIHTDEVASQVAAFYEKARNVVDYKEEHLIRRKFIDRVLHRRLLLKQDGVGIGEVLVKEIIRAGYLPNDTIPEAIIEDIQNIVDKHVTTAGFIPSQDKKKYKKRLDWLFSITASSIEEKLFPSYREDMLVGIMFRTIKERLVVRGGTIPEEEMNIQLFIAIHSTLLKADEDQLEYQTLKFLYPDWETITLEECPRVGAYIPAMRRQIRRALNHPLKKSFLKLCMRYAIVFHVLGDMVDRSKDYTSFEKVISDPMEFEREVREVYDTRFVAAKKKLKRIGFLSVLSFFLSKILIVLLIEIPIETRLTGTFSVMNTSLNVIIPPLLMFLIMLRMKMPRPVNFNLVSEQIHIAVFPPHDGHKYVLSIPKKKKILTEIISNLFYVVTVLAVFYLFSVVLTPLKFNVANIIVFLFFVSLVAAAGVRIHNRANEMNLEKRKTNIITFMFDLVSIPFVTVGKWVIDGLARFNPIVIFINLMIELPFQMFVEFVENFHGFVRQKKEDIT